MKQLYKGEGLTVEKLKEYLEKCPNDLPVYGTWEGTVHNITEIEIETWSGAHCVDDGRGGEAVFFDVDER